MVRLVTNYGEGLQNGKGGGGTGSFTPTKRGDSFYPVAISFSHIEGRGGGGGCTKKSTL